MKRIVTTIHWRYAQSANNCISKVEKRRKKWRWSEALKRWTLTRQYKEMLCCRCCCWCHFFYLMLISFVPVNFLLMHSVHLSCMFCAIVCVCVSLCCECVFAIAIKNNATKLVSTFPFCFSFLFLSSVHREMQRKSVSDCENEQATGRTI